MSHQLLLSSVKIWLYLPWKSRRKSVLWPISSMTLTLAYLVAESAALPSEVSRNLGLGCSFYTYTIKVDQDILLSIRTPRLATPSCIVKSIYIHIYILSMRNVEYLKRATTNTRLIARLNHDCNSCRSLVSLQPWDHKKRFQKSFIYLAKIWGLRSTRDTVARVHVKHHWLLTKVNSPHL